PTELTARAPDYGRPGWAEPALPLRRRGGGALDFGAQAPVRGDRVGPSAGVEDRVVGELDPVDDAGWVEDVDVVARLGVVDDLGDLEPAGDDLLAVVRPHGGRVVDGVVVTAELEHELEGSGPLG